MMVEGKVTFDHVPALDSSEGGAKLDFNAKTKKPARRVVVQAISGNSVVGEGVTDDEGKFSFSTSVTNIKLRVYAVLEDTSHTKDGIGPENCSGASWEIYVVDNTNSGAVYTVEKSNVTAGETTNIHIPLKDENSSTNSDRIAGPFAILDTALREMELVCQAKPSQSFPFLYINWSPNNTNTGGSYTLGLIGTSHYTEISGTPHLFILGDAGVDTDEYDDHVVAHEFGHYVEKNIYRGDSVGGAHSIYDSLDPRVAFSEGFGNAISGMTFSDPVYVDTSGANSASGFEFDVRTAAAAYSVDLKTVYSEFNVQNFLWSLFDARDGVTDTSGSFDRIDPVLRLMKKEKSSTTLQSFAAFYNQKYGGTAEGLSSLWAALGNSYNSLCSGACTGSGDTADPLDVDNDLGTAYNAAGIKYPPSTGAVQTTGWWSLYKLSTLSVIFPDTIKYGSGSGGSTHTGGILNYPYNKFGAHRLFQFTGDGNSITVKVDTSNTVVCTGTSSDLKLSLVIWSAGSIVDSDTTSGDANCPSVTFTSVNGRTYIVAAYLKQSYVGPSPIAIYFLAQ
ncbi:MAG: hypothetical protein ABUK01_01565 [Leptospirales bacterium]